MTLRQDLLQYKGLILNFSKEEDKLGSRWVSLTGIYDYRLVVHYYCLTFSLN